MKIVAISLGKRTTEIDPVKHDFEVSEKRSVGLVQRIPAFREMECLRKKGQSETKKIAHFIK